MKVGSLFSGIGGLDLGLERAGMKIVWQVEIDTYCQKVLAKHWPKVRRHDDVKTFPPEPVEEWKCDLICGGFPCQDISNAGKRAGIEGARSGLWSEFARIIRVLRPRYVLVENVAALLGRGAGRVLGDLAECGYDAEWDCLPAAAFGALHIRNRVFLLAYANTEGTTGLPIGAKAAHASACFGDSNGADTEGKPGTLRTAERGRERRFAGSVSESVIPNSTGCRCEEAEAQAPKTQKQERQAAKGSDQRRLSSRFNGCCAGHDSDSTALLRSAIFGGESNGDMRSLGGNWDSEPNVGRVAHGIPSRVDRLRGLGNAVVPQIAEWIGKRIMESAPGRAAQIRGGKK